jgi:hypothetical protein
MDALSRLLFQGFDNNSGSPLPDLSGTQADLEYVASMSEQEFSTLLDTANKHHVLVRALRVVEQGATQNADGRLVRWGQGALEGEESRIHFAVETLEHVCSALESSGCKAVVIKSLDHWPDLGSDLDLFTAGNEHTVVRVMKDHFKAELEPRSWGDRLANKWNFRIPGLPELIEIHVRYLGQTGEHTLLAERVIDRRVSKNIGGLSFPVPAPEERIEISTLQRMYRHFYFRLCDMVDFTSLIQSQSIDYSELRRASEAAGIWEGVATFLFLVAKYAEKYGRHVELPCEVIASAYSQDIRVYLHSGFLRVPKSSVAGLYASQLLNAGKHGDLRALYRLPLLPPLAISALLAYRITGSDKGIW